MKNDYIYCQSTTCIHRRGCRRSLGNYSEAEVKELYTNNRFIDEVDTTKCIPNYMDVDCENDYHFLDRFRYSDGREMNDRKL